MQHIQSLADEARSPLTQQNALHYVTDIAQAYANIGNVARQQSLLQKNFDALLSIDLSTDSPETSMKLEKI